MSFASRSETVSLLEHNGEAVTILELGDDVGMQQTIMMSREMYREWLMPRLKRVIQAAREQGV